MKSFLQSSQWADFQESFGRKTFRIDEKLIIEYSLPLGLSYFYSPRVYFKDDKKFTLFLKEAKKYAKNENAVFFRIEPDINSAIQQFDNSTMKQCKTIQPQDTLILDLNKSQDEILQQMHPKTRYNIRLAERHDIKIKKSYNKEDVNIFYNLALKTSARDNFSYHPRSYYEKMIEMLGKSKMVQLFISYHGKIPTAAVLVMFYEKSAVYLHGASDHSYRNLMSPYLLQWEAIKEARKRACVSYDFWGIAPPEAETKGQKNIETKEHRNKFLSSSVSQFSSVHPWAGVTRFKMGFAPNGCIFHYPDAFDLIYQPNWYRIYSLARKIRTSL